MKQLEEKGISFAWLDLSASTSRFRSARQSAPSATSPRGSSVRSGCSSMWTASARRFGVRTLRRRESLLLCLELWTRFTLAVGLLACCRRSSSGRYSSICAVSSTSPRMRRSRWSARRDSSRMRLSHELLQQGMNRISFGVQSFVDRETAAVGRLHTEQQCEAEFARVRAAGVEEINIDLIAGLPHQTAQSWRYSVEQAIASGAPHISVYLLEVDDESRLGREMLEQGSRYSASAVPSEDETAEWYQQACTTLPMPRVCISTRSRTLRGPAIVRATISSTGSVSHTWALVSMLTRCCATDAGAVRFANTSDLDEYLGNGAATPFRLLESASNTAASRVRYHWARRGL